MKNLRFVLLISFSCVLAGRIFGQTQFEVPQDIVLKSQLDYDHYDSAIIEAAKWLEENDINKEVDKRQGVVDFVLRWLEGSHSVTMEMTPPMMKLYEKNDPLLAIFLASYARNALENKRTPGQFNATRAAVLSIIIVYKKGISITKTKLMERAVKMNDENKLDQFITDVMGVQKD